ncbi:S1 RNA-binding domain-containing protein [Candidatus Giovannonibacteria bacterium]|nr:S1 RNA-binding domain-containing protein [Candidatus Giovannonibacteria bacterium]
MEQLLKTRPKEFLKVGELVEGVVLEKRGSRVFFDLGPHGTGIIYGREFQNARDMVKSLKVGEKIAGKIVEVENDSGMVELSLKEAGEEMVWKEAVKLRDSKEFIDLEVVDSNKGGLVLEWKNVKGFLPASQLKASHYPRVQGGDKDKISEELKKLVGETISVNILDFEPKEGKLIFSEKSSESEELKEIVGKYKIGDTVEGEVTGVVDFGIFIKIEEGLEGLAHVSELDWALVEDPRNLFKAGDRVKAKIIVIEGDKISLSVKALRPDPWEVSKDKQKKGDIVEGKILRLNKFGALTLLPSGIYGLSHISEFGTESKMREILKVGEHYVFQIMVYQPENKKLSLSYLGKPGEKHEPKEPAVSAEPKPKKKDTDEEKTLPDRQVGA